MQTQISNKIALESVSVDLKISIRKLICAKWMTHCYDHIRTDEDIVKNALKDVYMLNYGIIKNTGSSYYTRFFVIKFFYHIISSKQTHLVFCTFPTIFER